MSTITLSLPDWLITFLATVMWTGIALECFSTYIKWRLHRLEAAMEHWRKTHEEGGD